MHLPPAHQAITIVVLAALTVMAINYASRKYPAVNKITANG